jgi:8-oxo-dGTP diphosphatase
MIPIYLQNRPFLPLASDRLTLRPLEEKDAIPMTTLANDRRVAQNLARLPHPYTLTDAHKFITYAREGITKGTHIPLAIIRRADQTFIGVAGLEEEVGYWLGHAFWGQGYGKEAVRALVDFAFLTLQIDTLSGSARTDNTASRRIFEGLGFTQTDTKELTSLVCEGKNPGITYGLSRQSFLEQQKTIHKPIVWVVAAALINDEGQLLLAERPLGKTRPGIWEPPGGKIEEGETPEQALVRELREEIGIDVREEDLEPLFFTSYPYDSYHLVMPLYLCSRWKGTPHGAEGQNLTWVTYADLAHIPSPPADILLCHRLADMLMTRGIWDAFPASPAKHLFA